MTTFNNTLPTKDIGIFVGTSKIAYSGAIVTDIYFSEVITLIKCYEAPGYIVWQNYCTKENQIDYINLGETIPVLAGALMATATVNGKSTTAQGIIVKSSKYYVGD